MTPDTEIELLKRDVSVFEKYFSRIDITMEKLDKLLSETHRLVSLHDERIEQHHQDIKALQTSIKTLETWRYVVVGGAIVIFFFLGQGIKSYINRVIDPQEIQIVTPPPQHNRLQPFGEFLGGLNISEDFTNVIKRNFFSSRRCWRTRDVLSSSWCHGVLRFWNAVGHGRNY